MTNRSLNVGIAPFARQQELWPGAGVHSARNLTCTCTWAVGRGRGPAPEGVGGGLQGKVI